MTATIEEMKVVLKTACYRDFHIKLKVDTYDLVSLVNTV
ncbi:hypothetical protein MTBBW1_60001 [Desulfamplus magnetovallimortis]|uniref:Uncharacterized protein n=1 Tax=Desulfamplus magnetovallimortis TaxID=1246637 RepID=A0A1W1HHW7_9BACT|nr:hypothetical protein MTBBW1_60001 [Desulfamplus magnetovallimortis]